MMSSKQFAAALGFAFVAVWITLSFGWAVLCLVGALAFYAAALLLERGFDLSEIQSRFGGRSSL